MWLFGLLTLGGLALLAIVAVRILGGGIIRTPASQAVLPGNGARSAVPPRRQAQQILDERYARGELITEEYRDRLQILDGT